MWKKSWFWHHILYFWKPGPEPGYPGFLESKPETRFFKTRPGFENTNIFSVNNCGCDKFFIQSKIMGRIPIKHLVQCCCPIFDMESLYETFSFNDLNINCSRIKFFALQFPRTNSREHGEFDKPCIVLGFWDSHSWTCTSSQP